MAGTLDINGNAVFAITRLTGSPVDLEGTVNVFSQAGIAADEILRADRRLARHVPLNGRLDIK